MWTPSSTAIKTISAGLGFIGEYNRSKTVEREGKYAREIAQINAEALMKDAQRRFAAGVREGAEYRRQGEITESNAIANMAAMGGGVDPEMLARLKQKANYNTMSAIYDSAVAASDIRAEARNVRSQGEWAKMQADARAKDIRFSAAITALKDLPLSYAQKPKKPRPGYGKPPSNIGYDRSG